MSSKTIGSAPVTTKETTAPRMLFERCDVEARLKAFEVVLAELGCDAEEPSQGSFLD
jgi:hypothetical protein